MVRAVRCFLLALSAALALSLLIALSSPGATTPHSLGSRLINRFLVDVKRHDVADLRAFLSPAFQIQRADGSRLGKGVYLQHLPTVRSFKVRNLVATSSGGTPVGTYEVASEQVINGKQFHTEYAPRLSVFVKAGNHWQLLAHANFNTPK
jgi:hypothetical protein